MAKTGQRFLVVYSLVLTAVFAITVYGAATPKKASFDEIDVHRINVVEPDGTLRMVLMMGDQEAGSFSTIPNSFARLRTS